MLNKSRLLPAVLAATIAISVPIAAFAAPAAPAADNPVVKPAELKPLIEQADVRVLDIRAPKDYAAGHIPGAVNTPYAAYRGPADNAGALPAETRLTELLRQAGITADTRVIVAHAGNDHTDFGAAARVYWTLKVGGLTRLSILDGGTLGWKAAGGALDTAAPKIAPTAFTYHYNKAMIAETQELAAEVQAGKAPVLVDARPAAFFKGEQRVDAAARYGTLPGARSLDNAAFFNADDKTLRSADELQQAVRQAGLADKDAVSFCNTGHWAATDWFVLSEIAGNKRVKLYPQSVVEWSKTKLPMQNEPSRMTALMQDAKRSLKK
ncbi:rhodanese-like domain-containing protein [Massilia solisilvae]|uniref:Rhodanese-like domain-containing protein n=1 Tax=Massilia solisilvae TaxID=1811225 RepID=A0ABT2BK12_9BURK|nr:rhodanese-like domain-containing protein [Massilia solisilvae]MCS0608847.1 rhodanese-like domain-containing protein [Massilia solisilvae]